MLNITQQILQEIVVLINAYRDGEPPDKINSHSLAIKNSFSLLRSDNRIKDFYLYISQEFKDDTELHLLLLSVINNVIMDEDSIVEMLQILYQGNIDLFLSANIRTQVERCIFTNTKINIFYYLRRKLHKSLILRLEDMLNIQLPYRPLNRRNDNKIVIITNQLLADLHAPTNITKEICYILQKKLGMEVLLIVAVEDTNSRLGQLWLNYYTMNYIEQYTGNFVTERHEEKINGYQIIMNQKNILEIKGLVEEIYHYNPICIWYMGGVSLFADLLRKFTTVLAMPFTEGFAISDAQVMINYFKTKTEKITDMELYLKETDQIPLLYEFNTPIQRSEIKYIRESYDLNDNNFLITIVGNRLDSEVTDEFLLFLKQVLMINTKIVIVFIGGFNKYSTLMQDEVFASRSKCLGFQKDLIGILSIMDLFLNPPRQGGGTGAIYALYNGIPVVTLNFCDVANYIDKNDVCDNEEDMIEQIKKYVSDSEYYDKQSKKANLIHKKMDNDKWVNDTKDMLDKVKKIIPILESSI